MRKLYLSIIICILSGCTGLPDGVNPVKNFEIEKYAGKWYEIARLDHIFERGLENITAEYSLRDDGGIKVINRGFSTVENKWKNAEGKALFVRGKNEGYLKVSFWGPFYASYVVFELDKQNYSYAFVSGKNKGYLWLLSRSPVVDKEILDLFINKSREYGYETDKLIFVKHTKQD